MTDRHEDLEDLVLSEVHLGSKPGDSACSTCFSILQPAALEGASFHSSGDRQPDATYAEASSSDDFESLQQHTSLKQTEADRRKSASSSKMVVAVDETGDLDVPRKRTCRQPQRGGGQKSSQLAIHHSLATALRNVGLQVWRGALLLADYIIHQEHTAGRFRNATALELGAGTGLAGIVMARTAQRVYITDKGEDVLNTCLRNVISNSLAASGSKCHVAVRELDWFNFSAVLEGDGSSKPARDDKKFSGPANRKCQVASQDWSIPHTSSTFTQPAELGTAELEPSKRRVAENPLLEHRKHLSSHASAYGLLEGARTRPRNHCEKSERSKVEDPVRGTFLDGSRGLYAWSREELEDLRHVSVLLAADVIYDDVLTDVFFECVEELMSIGTAKTLYLSLEKRFNFSLDDRAVVANGYSNFRAKFDDVSSGEGGPGAECEGPRKGNSRLRGRRVRVDSIPQYLYPYERGPDLELWEISKPV